MQLEREALLNNMGAYEVSPNFDKQMAKILMRMVTVNVN